MPKFHWLWKTVVGEPLIDCRKR